jgi:hypothetical protein
MISAECAWRPGSVDRATAMQRSIARDVAWTAGAGAQLGRQRSGQLVEGHEGSVDLDHSAARARVGEGPFDHGGHLRD